MDQPLLLTISKNEAVYIMQGLQKLLDDTYRQETAFIKMAVPGENSLERLTEYYNRRKLDLHTLIAKYKNVFS